jgi:membrane protein DedA with SNARE-associated domain
MLLYFFGRRYGRAFFEEKNYRYFSANDIVRVERKLAKWGAVIIIGSRFVVGFRSALAIGAGIGRYPPWRMLVFSLFSYFAFTGLLLYIAVKLVDNIDTVERYLYRYNQIIWPLLIGVVIVYVVRRYRKMRKTR